MNASARIISGMPYYVVDTLITSLEDFFKKFTKIYVQLNVIFTLCDGGRCCARSRRYSYALLVLQRRVSRCDSLEMLPNGMLQSCGAAWFVSMLRNLAGPTLFF